MIRSTLKTLVLSIAILFVFNISAFATSAIFMDFQGLQDKQTVGNFYMQKFGVTFTNFNADLSAFQGGSGGFAITPLGTPAIFVNGTLGSPSMGTITSAKGFSGGINFYFTAGFAPGQTGTVTVWSGANGTGTVLATITLANNNGSCTGFPSYCTWSNVGAQFSGTAHSVTFSGGANQLGITDITLGSGITAIPEPSSVYLLGTGLFGMCLGRVRRYLGV